MHGRRLPAAAAAVAVLAACGPASAPPAGAPMASPALPSAPAVADLAIAATPRSPAAANPRLEPSPLARSTASAVARLSPAPPRGDTLPAGLRGVEWTRLPTSRRVVALTFDAGAGAEGVPSILDTLAREKVPGTFFITGRWAATYPDLARRLVAAGHQVGNHTMDHPDLTTLSDAQVTAEVADGARAIQDATGRDQRPLFRFPYGARDQRVLADVNALGFGSIRWTIDTLGWKGSSGGQGADGVYARALGAAEPGEIVLMHVGAAPDGSMLDADALPRVIEELRRRGYGFVAVGDFTRS